MRAKLILLAFVMSAGHSLAQAQAQAPTPAPPTPPSQERIRQLIGELGHDTFKVREAAHRELTRWAEHAGEALAEAVDSENPEQAQRAKSILGWISVPYTHRVVDALGQPIRWARVVIKQGDATTATFTDRLGRIGVPNPDKKEAKEILVEVRHADYGIGRWLSGVRIFGGAELIECKMPLVAAGSEARKRAVHGRVVDGHGKPVSGAVINCRHVRTQGEGLLTGDHQAGDAITDGEGQFAVYLPYLKPYRDQKLHGDLVPPGSRYDLTVKAPERDDCFPLDDLFSNAGPIDIRMPLATRRYQFRFPLPGGGELSEPKQLRNVVIEYYSKDNEPYRVRIDPEDVIKGRTLLPGKYVATHYDMRGKQIRYLPLRVDEKSPEILTFSLPGPESSAVFRGRVVHGLTGKPMPGAWAAATNASARSNLAELTADDWKVLRAASNVPVSNDPAFKIVSRHYGVGALVRANDDGRFELKEPASGEKFYDVMVFDQDFLPIAERVAEIKRDGEAAIELADFPLFPASKIDVKLVGVGDGKGSFSTEWKLEAGDQPDWSGRLRGAADRTTRREFRLPPWIPINQSTPILIPSGVRVRLSFHSPYDDQWAPATTEIVQGKQAEAIAAVEVALTKSLPVSVRVADARGVPIEGLAIRSLRSGSNIWTVAHTTDAKGLAYFLIPPNSAGKFRVELGARARERTPENLEKTYRIGDQPPDLPIEIRLTAEQTKDVPKTGDVKK